MPHHIQFLHTAGDPTRSLLHARQACCQVNRIPKCKRLFYTATSAWQTLRAGNLFFSGSRILPTHVQSPFTLDCKRPTLSPALALLLWSDPHVCLGPSEEHVASTGHVKQPGCLIQRHLRNLSNGRFCDRENGGLGRQCSSPLNHTMWSPCLPFPNASNKCCNQEKDS